MIQKLAILSILLVSATCTYIHQVPVILRLQPIIPQILPQPNRDYNFAYSVNEPQTGDIKNQQETRRDGVVIGQYSLIQPDGVKRTVDYRADHIGGFRATVNNERENERQIDSYEEQREMEDQRVINHAQIPQVQSTTQLPPPLSRTSIVQTFDNSRPVIRPSNPWN